MTSATEKPKSGFFYGWFILGGALLICAIGYSMRYSFGMFMPSLLDEFGWARADAALASSISILAYGLTSPLVGWATDKFGPRKVLVFGAFLLAGGLALSSLINSLWMLYISFGVVAAIGINCLGFAVHFAYVPNWFVMRRGLAFGIVMASAGLGNVIVGVYGPIIEGVGWSNAFLVLAGLALVVIIPIALFVIKRHPEEKGQLPDGMAAAPGPEAAAKRQKMMECLIVDREWTSQQWNLGKALKTSRLWYMFFWFLTVSFTLNLVMLHQVTYTKDLGFDASTAAFLFSFMGFSMMAGQLGLGFLSDRIGREITYAIFSVGILAGLVCIWAAGPDSLWLLYAYAILFGVCLGAGTPVGFAGLSDMFFGRGYGAINGFCLLGFGIGGFFGPWLAGKIYDTTGSYDWAFISAIIALVISVFVYWMSSPSKVRLCPGKAAKMMGP